MELRSVEGLFDRMTNRGEGVYGLSTVSQVAHGEQSAALAVERGLGDALTVAALFHDIGHLRTATDAALAQRGIDDRHETVGARLLDEVFGPDVREPVRLHGSGSRSRRET